jgi:hypothetical protein
LWFAFTESFCLVATLLARRHFHSIPAAFSDIYILAVIAVTYCCSWKWGLAAVAFSVPMAVYLLIPIDNSDIFTITSMAVSSVVIVLIMRAASHASRA